MINSLKELEKIENLSIQSALLNVLEFVEVARNNYFDEEILDKMDLSDEGFDKSVSLVNALLRELSSKENL